MNMLDTIRRHAEDNFIVLALVLLIIFFGVSSENFFSLVTLTTILNQLPALTVVTVGMTLVLIVVILSLQFGITYSELLASDPNWTKELTGPLRNMVDSLYTAFN